MPKGAELKPIAEAASELGVSRMTLYRWIDSGKLTVYTRTAGLHRTFVDIKEARRLLEPRPMRRRK